MAYRRRGGSRRSSTRGMRRYSSGGRRNNVRTRRSFGRSSSRSVSRTSNRRGSARTVRLVIEQVPAAQTVVEDGRMVMPSIAPRKARF